MARVIHEQVGLRRRSDLSRRSDLIYFWSFLIIASLGLLLSGDAMAQDRDDEDDDDEGQTAELALSNDTLQLRYIGSGGAVGVEDSRIVGTMFLGEERDFVLSGGLLFPADLGFRRLQLSFGPQLYAALLRDENDDVMAITIGAELRFVILRKYGLAISGQAYHSPDILTFGTADNLTDLSARVEIGAAEQLQVFGGMRWFEFDLTEGSGERTLQEEVFVGIGYRF